MPSSIEVAEGPGASGAWTEEGGTGVSARTEGALM
jgi:hypothetical protein